MAATNRSHLLSVTDPDQLLSLAGIRVRKGSFGSGANGGHKLRVPIIKPIKQRRMTISSPVLYAGSWT